METSTTSTASEPEPTGSTAPASGTPESADPTTAEPERTGGQAWPYALSAATYLLVPFALGVVLPAETATTALLALLTAGALLLGVIDGVVFRTTWAFPVITGILCLIGLQMYTEDGTWIYAIGVVVLCRLGSMRGGRRGRRG